MSFINVQCLSNFGREYEQSFTSWNAHSSFCSSYSAKKSIIKGWSESKTHYTCYSCGFANKYCLIDTIDGLSQNHFFFFFILYSSLQAIASQMINIYVNCAKQEIFWCYFNNSWLPRKLTNKPTLQLVFYTWTVLLCKCPNGDQTKHIINRLYKRICGKKCVKKICNCGPKYECNLSITKILYYNMNTEWRDHRWSLAQHLFPSLLFLFPASRLVCTGLLARVMKFYLIFLFLFQWTNKIICWKIDVMFDLVFRLSILLT